MKKVLTGLFTVAVFACFAILTWASPNIGGETARVHAIRAGGCGGIQQQVLREFVRQLKGDVQIRPDACTHVFLMINAVISGSAVDPSFAKRPFGSNNLSVYMIDDAAVGLGSATIAFGFRDNDAEKKFSGVWTLHALPSGDFAVWNAKDTPFFNDVSIKRRQLNEGVAKGLKSSDPGAQYDALVAWRKNGGLFLQIPLIIRLIDSDYKIPEPFGAATLGEYARQQLVWAIGLFENHSTLTIYEDVDDYTKWWEGVLHSRPPVTRSVVTGKTLDIAKLTLNQNPYPEFLMSPDGHRAVVGFTRQDQPIDDTKNAIVLFDARDDWKMKPLYKVPMNAINVEPSGIAASWSEDGFALAWLEQRYDPKNATMKFASFDRNGAIITSADLGIQTRNPMALARSSIGWILAYTTLENKLFVRRVGKDGQIFGAPIAISLPTDPNSYNGDVVGLVALLDTKDGPVLVARIGSAKASTYMVMLDADLHVTKTTLLVNPGNADSYFAPSRVAWNGRVYCIEWIQFVNGRSDLGVGFTDADGKSIGRFITLSDSLKMGAGTLLPTPVPMNGGFTVAWADRSNLLHDVHIATVYANRDHVDEKLALSQKDEPRALSLGVDTDKTRIMTIGNIDYPQRIIVKEMSSSSWN